MLIAAELFGFDAAQAQTRRLSRTEDFVVLTGAQLPNLIGTEIRDLHLYACGRSGRAPVPFQVDKRDAEGRYVFPDEKFRDPHRDGTRLDANDELVFMARDAGGLCPEPTGNETVMRGAAIELRDPLDGGRGWVYLWVQPGVEPARTKDYVSYRIENERELMAGENYEIGQKLGATYYDWLRLKTPDGSFSPDLLNRTKLGLKARVLSLGIPIHVPERDMKSVTLGVIDGPVRVIRDELDVVKIKALGINWDTEAFYTYYGNGHLSPMEANFPVNLNKMFLDIRCYWAMDLNDIASGSVFKNPANPQGVILDGRAGAKLNTKTDARWFLVRGPQWGMVDAMIFSRELSELLTRTTLVREELVEAESAEDHPGRLLVGYWVKVLDRLTKGVYRWQLYHYYPVPFAEDRAQEILNLIEHPLQVSVVPIGEASTLTQ